jgi:type II secretory pathway component PulF
MPFVFTPGQLSRRADFYHQLGQLTGAGLGLVRALEHLQRNPPASSYREPIRLMLAELAHGYTLTESMQRTGDWLSPLDQALLRAGEQSGRLDACMRLLADYYTDRARVARQVLIDLAYPAFLFHFAVFIIPFSNFFMSGNWVLYLAQTFGVLLPIYGMIGFGIYAAQSRHGETWRGWVERILGRVPVLGTARHYLALSRLSAALEALLSAGVSIIEGWEMAATASGSPALRRTVLEWRPLVDAGQTPAEAVSSSAKFPDLFASQYAAGEVSGKLDETLRRLHEYYREEGTRKLHLVSQWTPRVVYLLVAGMIAFFVLRAGLAYINMIRDAGGF